MDFLDFFLPRADDFCFPGELLSIPRERSPSICHNCTEHIGQMFSGESGDNYFVCGIHPYGNGEECDDFVDAVLYSN